MKKFLTYIFLFALLIVLNACGSDDEAPNETIIETYDVTFMVDGTPYKIEKTNESGKVVLPQNPQLGDSKYFDGWYLDEGAWNLPLTSNTVIEKNTMVYAKIVAKHSVSFMVFDSKFEVVWADKDGKFTMPQNPKLGEYYEFDGWYLDDKTFNVPFTSNTLINEDTVVYAKIITKHIIQFMVGNKQYEVTKTDKEGNFIMPSAPTLDENYAFAGWYLDEGEWKIPFTLETVVSENTAVYAKIVKIYNIKFMVGDEEYAIVKTDINGLFTMPKAPDVLDEYEFKGWYFDQDTWNKEFLPSATLTSDVVVYANISVKKYHVNFIIDDKTYYETYVVKNEIVDTPNTSNLGVGYEFLGWYLDEGTWEIPYDATLPITKDIEVYAKMNKQVLNPTNGGTIEILNIGSKVWSTNDYVFTSLPKAFLNKPYILWSINGPNTATSIKSGWVYGITGEALDFGTTGSQMDTFDKSNFTLLDTAYFNIWSAALKNNVIYEKYVEAGEDFSFGRWSVIIMSDTKLDIYEGEPIPTDDKLAVLKPSGSDTVVNMALNAKVFSNREYKFYDMPYWLAGKNYIQSSYGANAHSATVTKAGEVYMFTSKAGNISQVNALLAKGWTNVTDTIPSDLNIFGDDKHTPAGAFLNTTYQGFALLKKTVEQGEKITWDNWAIPVFSGEFVIASDIATLVAASSTTAPARVEDGMWLFNDRTYYAMNGIPLGLEGLTYFLDGIEEGATVKAATAGTAYLMIPSGTNAYKALQTAVESEGWKPVAHRSFRLAPGLLFQNRIYYKHVEVNEEIHFAKYNLIFGAPLENEEGYYEKPSITTPADVIVNPVGDFYDINLQNWLGCPTIERTANGRIWAGWFTGGQRELGTGNYAIIYYSDNDCATWHQAVAVVHPDTAVQVTKPELWTAPNGDLWLFWIQHTGTGNFDGIMGTWASVCTNPDAENPTWSTPQRLTDGYMRSKPIIVDVDGTTTWMYSAFDWMQPHYTKVYASTDNGATWSLRGAAECIDTTGVNNLDDPVLVQKPDGTLWLLMRPSHGTVVYESFSTDGGYTWTHARLSNIVGPQSRFTIDLLDDGKMLMVFHDSTSRNRLTAYLSLDGGKTWKYKLLIDERNYVSYPDTIITSDGTIYVIYDRNRTTDREVWLTVFTLEDVIAGKYVSEEGRQFILVDKAR